MFPSEVEDSRLKRSHGRPGHTEAAEELWGEVSGGTREYWRVVSCYRVVDQNVNCHILKLGVAPTEYFIMRDALLVVLSGDFEAVNLANQIQPCFRGLGVVHKRGQGSDEVRTVDFQDDEVVNRPARHNTELHIDNSKNMFAGFWTRRPNIADTWAKTKLVKDSRSHHDLLGIKRGLVRACLIPQEETVLVNNRVYEVCTCRENLVSALGPGVNGGRRGERVAGGLDGRGAEEARHFRLREKVAKKLAENRRSTRDIQGGGP